MLCWSPPKAFSSGGSQILEECDFKEEDFGLFQLAGQRCIDDGHVDQLLEIIQDEKNKTIIKSMGWNLVGPVVRCLLRNGEEDKREDCFLMFDLLLKHAYEVTTSNNLVSVAVLQKLPNNKAYSVGLALSTLWSQLSLLPVPYSEEQIQTDDYGLCQCCKALIEFIRPFVEEVIDNKENKENEKLKDELLKFPSYLLQLNMEHIELFLQRTEQSIFSKGLELLENSLLRLEDSSLLYQYLEIKSFLAVPQVLHSALFTFDLIESVLARVEELIEIKTKSTSEENVGIK
ncbi:Glomulin [Cricetulus griseus]|uniref:Glomulin n=1 Tax=Cricetulus griseus TaxID=10029 RepID=G3HEC3_CRIGR|nr:Glomulin [Cricetulus griseus]